MNFLASKIEYMYLKLSPSTVNLNHYILSVKRPDGTIDICGK